MMYGLLALILVSAMTAIAATNTVPSTRLTSQGSSIGINDLKPMACGAIFLTHLVTGSGTITGTTGNDLILASPGADMIDGSGGDDCIVGGGDSDVCTGGLGTDVFVSCETQTQ
jgi:Ca2+-binding RTX toxin-like protein